MSVQSRFQLRILTTPSSLKQDHCRSRSEITYMSSSLGRSRHCLSTKITCISQFEGVARSCVIRSVSTQVNSFKTSAPTDEISGPVVRFQHVSIQVDKNTNCSSSISSARHASPIDTCCLVVMFPSCRSPTPPLSIAPCQVKMHHFWGSLLIWMMLSIKLLIWQLKFFASLILSGVECNLMLGTIVIPFFFFSQLTGYDSLLTICTIIYNFPKISLQFTTKTSIPN
jgi:hypothetical protein